MTHPSTYSLLFFTLLLSCGGCKKQDDPAIPVQPNSCLIATQTTKELVSPSQQSKLDPETVTISGESFNVTTTKKSAYTYDAQGRILTAYNQYAGGQVRPATGRADSVYYQYSPTAVNIRTVIFDDNGKTEHINIVSLDSQGFAEKQPTTYLATYDKEGYLTTLRDEYGQSTANIDNGNVVESTFGNISYGSIYITKNEYDLNKPGMPSVRAFYGKLSRNLLTRSVVDENTGHVLFPNVHTSTYTYTFDKNGRVKRQFTRDKQGEIGWIYGNDSASIIDFTYTCP
ncbi:hypothetical protein [Spirosoma areae]